MKLRLIEKKVVVLEIPSAINTPTSFDGIRYIRIGSSKVNVAKYPDREARLFDVLRRKEKQLIVKSLNTRS